MPKKKQQDLEELVLGVPGQVRAEHLRLAKLEGELDLMRRELVDKQEKMYRLIASKSKRKKTLIEQLWVDITESHETMLARQEQKIALADELGRLVKDPLESLNTQLKGVKEVPQEAGRKRKTVARKAFCYCGGPAFGEMVCCDNLFCPREWFHLECIGQRMAPKGNWFCLYCKKK